MSDLDKAIQLATQAHAGQVDKAGKPYILHPLRVMFSLSRNDEHLVLGKDNHQFTSEDAQIVGVLHDTVEDTHLTLKDLGEHFPNYIVDAVNALTRRPKEEYSHYLVRVQSNKLAATVKLADLRDNLDLTRIENPNDRDFRRWQKYTRSYKSIEQGLK